MKTPPVTTSSMHVYEGSPKGGARAGLVCMFANGATDARGVYFLPEGRVVIGRDETAELCIEATAVSRKHAAITFDHGNYTIVDLASRNGIIVDGAFVSEAQLTHGAIIRIGDALFKFVAVGAENYGGYRYDGSLEVGFCRKVAGATMLVGGAQMDRIAASLERIAPTMLSVIVFGESGTGKEVAAGEVHRLSGRRGAFVPVNCAAIPAQLLESELFGYRKGAFSGADRDKIGLVKAAHGGTLFLDEIGDMPVEAQTKLLRVLQAREVMPIGSTAAEPVDVRVVCATHRDLTLLQNEGKFRGDLFARLAEYCVTLPPLRDRREDVFLLARAMLFRHGRPDLRMSVGFALGLLTHHWPFNVRELEACMKRAIALADGPELDVAQLPDGIREELARYGRRTQGSIPPEAPRGFRQTPVPGVPAVPMSPEHARVTAVPTEAELRALLMNHRGNVAAVGRVLGKERMQIHRWMKRYNIEIDDYRE